MCKRTETTFAMRLRSRLSSSSSHQQEPQSKPAEDELTQMKGELNSVRESLTDMHTELQAVRKEVRGALDQLGDCQLQLARITAGMLTSSCQTGQKVGSGRSSSSGSHGHDAELDQLRLMMNSLSETIHKKVQDFEIKLLHEFSQLETFVKDLSQGNDNIKNGMETVSSRALRKKADPVVQSLDGKSSMPTLDNKENTAVHSKGSESRNGQKTSMHNEGNAMSGVKSVSDWVSTLMASNSPRAT